MVFTHSSIVIDMATTEQARRGYAEYGQALLLSPGGGEDRQEMYKQFIGMFEPNGVIDIAFKTDAL